MLAVDIGKLAPKDFVIFEQKVDKSIVVVFQQQLQRKAKSHNVSIQIQASVGDVELAETTGAT